MPDRERDIQLAKELALQALNAGGASTSYLPYAMGYEAQKIGEFVGTLYDTILDKVKTANDKAGG